MTQRGRFVGGIVLWLIAGCAPPAASPAPIGAATYDAASAYEPARDLGRLFHDVQLARVFRDSKTFADARPLHGPAEIVARYDAEHRSSAFSLREFVERNFELPSPVGDGVRADTSRTMEQHIRALWPTLTRAADRLDHRSTLIPLPHRYVVPGGRFREVYYWDNGNRTYYLGRSQPPFLAAMVGRYARAADSTRAARYLEALEAEHAFWMDGSALLAPGEAYRRAVRLPNGALLNRYWDDIPEPRPESYREDEALGRALAPAARQALYRGRARCCRERVGLLEPLDAGSGRSAHSGDDRAHAGRPEQSALPCRAHDRGAEASSRRSR